MTRCTRVATDSHGSGVSRGQGVSSTRCTEQPRLDTSVVIFKRTVCCATHLFDSSNEESCMMTSYVLALVTVLPRACGVGARTLFVRKFMRRAIVLESLLSSIRLALDAESCGGPRQKRFLLNAENGTSCHTLHTHTHTLLARLRLDCEALRRTNLACNSLHV